MTAAQYGARANLKTLVVEENSYIGGATVSLETYREDWKYSNCSYVSSLLRPEIYRALELHRHGLQVTPFGGSLTFMENGDYYGSYHDPEVAYRERARFSRRDADAYERYRADTMRQCRIIRDFLLSTAPDPTSFRPKDLLGLLQIGRKFLEVGEDRMYESIRFWTIAVVSTGDQGDGDGEEERSRGDDELGSPVGDHGAIDGGSGTENGHQRKRHQGAGERPIEDSSSSRDDQRALLDQPCSQDELSTTHRG